MGALLPLPILLTLTFGQFQSRYPGDFHGSRAVVTREVLSVTCIGDSITAGDADGSYCVNGYQDTYDLSVKLGAPWVVTNAGVFANTTTQMLARWATTIRATKPRVVVFLGGVNDVKTGELASVPIANITALLEQASADGATVVLVTTLPWKGDVGWTGAKQIQHDALNAFIRTTCASGRPNLRCLDAEPLMEDPARPDFLLPAYDAGDGIHPSRAGATQMADILLPVVRSCWP